MDAMPMRGTRSEPCLPAHMECCDPATAQVFLRLSREFACMQAILQKYMDGNAFQELMAAVASCLGTTSNLIKKGEIVPWNRLRLGLGEPEYPVVDREVRLGVFPVAANPFHWMHFISGLMAISRFRLDKVVYIIAGNDPRKPDLLPVSIRHQMGKEVLQVFSPFFEYSPIALDNSLPGEVNVFKLLQLNAAQRIHAFYLVGSDHFQRFDPETGTPDTIQRLEEGIENELHGFSGYCHKISLIFLDRGLPKPEVKTSLEIEWIRDLPLHCSSTSIRDALNGHQAISRLQAVPFTVFNYICAKRLYTPGTAANSTGDPNELHDHLCENIFALRRKYRDSLVSQQKRGSVPVGF
jgi:nicotinic acid mononucleotide adenylyltransferase